MTPAATFATLLTRFFTQRLLQQRQASPHTIKSYRDTFHLLLLFAKTKLGQEPSQLTFEQIDAPLVSSFLDDLQERRGVGASSIDGDPLVLSLRRIRIAGAVGVDSTRLGHSL
jgi:integrase/recombinase XerD